MFADPDLAGHAAGYPGKPHSQPVQPFEAIPDHDIIQPDLSVYEN
jgi:hypothetical protein